MLFNTFISINLMPLLCGGITPQNNLPLRHLHHKRNRNVSTRPPRPYFPGKTVIRKSFSLN
jgi:hypothetical protein